jgi:hypothetical protein
VIAKASVNKEDGMKRALVVLFLIAAVVAFVCPAYAGGAPIAGGEYKVMPAASSSVPTAEQRNVKRYFGRDFDPSRTLQGMTEYYCKSGSCPSGSETIYFDRWGNRLGTVKIYNDPVKKTSTTTWTNAEGKVVFQVTNRLKTLPLKSEAIGPITNPSK